MKTLTLIIIAIAILVSVQVGIRKGRTLERAECEAAKIDAAYYRAAYYTLSEATGLAVDEFTGEVEHGNTDR